MEGEVGEQQGIQAAGLAAEKESAGAVAGGGLLAKMRCQGCVGCSCICIHLQLKCSRLVSKSPPADQLCPDVVSAALYLVNVLLLDCSSKYT